MFSTAYKYYVLTTMTSVYMLNLVDRGLMMLLLQPIKEDLQLSDTQLGFLTGIAFALFYATLGVPIARWSDRGNRVTITSIAIALWGLTVMSCLFVSSFVQLMLSRIAAAVGESGCKPPTYSLTGDYFPEPAARTRALAIYIAGSPLSSLVSFIIGGWLNEIYGWRMTFFIMGIPALVLALIVKLTVVEPRTLQRDRAREQTAPPMSVVLETMWKQRSCRHLTFALILLYMMSLGLGPWYAAFMMRSHGMTTGELGVWLGLILSGGGVAGVLLGGFIASRWMANDERGQMRLGAITIASVLPCFIAFLTVPGKYQALLLLLPLMMALSIFLGPTYALLQRLVVDDMRATMMAVIMLLANLIGLGSGPQLVGILSDQLRPSFGDESLKYAMLSMAFISLWAATHLWLVGRTIRDDLKAVGRLDRTLRRDDVEDCGIVARPAGSK